MVGAEGFEPSTSSASRKHSSSELRAYVLHKLIYSNDLVGWCQYFSGLRVLPYVHACPGGWNLF